MLMLGFSSLLVLVHWIYNLIDSQKFQRLFQALLENAMLFLYSFEFFCYTESDCGSELWNKKSLIFLEKSVVGLHLTCMWLCHVSLTYKKHSKLNNCRCRHIILVYFGRFTVFLIPLWQTIERYLTRSWIKMNRNCLVLDSQISACLSVNTIGNLMLNGSRASGHEIHLQEIQVMVINCDRKIMSAIC